MNRPQPAQRRMLRLTRTLPSLDNGWNNVYTSPSSGRVRKVGVAAAVDRAEVNGTRPT